jgi:hypothetical protein
MTLYCIRYAGPFGFIKPWTAVRDEITYSQTFLAPGTVQGLSQKLFGLGERERIQRYRLQFDHMSEQQEMTWAPKRKLIREKGVPRLNNGVLTRGVMLNPQLTLAFSTQDEAATALQQHICLCRNEDILLPDPTYGDSGIARLTASAFEALPGYELRPAEDGLPVGRNRYEPGAPMTYGELIIV